MPIFFKGDRVRHFKYKHYKATVRVVNNEAQLLTVVWDEPLDFFGLPKPCDIKMEIVERIYPSGGKAKSRRDNV